jgi:ATP-binding cassette subfamily B multidrug efflux pump
MAGAPPASLLAFYWHFVRQTKGWYAAMFAASLAVAALDTVIPLFIGKLVSPISRSGTWC